MVLLWSTQKELLSGGNLLARVCEDDFRHEDSIRQDQTGRWVSGVECNQCYAIQ